MRETEALRNMPLVSIHIVTWNSRRFIGSCLESVFQQTLRDLEVTVVDNGSKDGTSRLIVERYEKQVRLIKNLANEGYCRGHNQAIAASSGEYVLALNPDVVMTPKFLVHIVEAMNTSPDIGAVNGKLLRVGPEAFDWDQFRLPSGDLPIDSAGLMMFRTRRQFLRGYMKSSGRFNERAYIFGPDGAAALYRRQMLEDVKIDGQYFDEAFFAQKEDVDLAWRAQLFGWKSLYAPEAVAYHVRGFRPGERKGMSSEIKRQAVKNRYLMMIKNELPGTFWRDWLHILFYDLKILGYILLFEQSSLLAFWDCIRLLPNALRWRKEIQRRRRVEPSYLMSLFL